MHLPPLLSKAHGFRQKTCCSKACFKKQNMQYQMVFFSACVSGEAQARAPRRGEGPLLVSQGRRARAGKDGPEELGGSRGEPWPVASVLSLFDPWEAPHVDFLCPPPPPTMVLNQDSSLGGKRSAFPAGGESASQEPVHQPMKQEVPGSACLGPEPTRCWASIIIPPWQSGRRVN